MACNFLICKSQNLKKFKKDMHCVKKAFHIHLICILNYFSLDHPWLVEDDC